MKRMQLFIFALSVQVASLYALQNEQDFIDACKITNQQKPISALEDSNKTLYFAIEHLDPEATRFGYITLKRLQTKFSLTKQELSERYKRENDAIEYEELRQNKEEA